MTKFKMIKNGFNRYQNASVDDNNTIDSVSDWKSMNSLQLPPKRKSVVFRTENSTNSRQSNTMDKSPVFSSLKSFNNPTTSPSLQSKLITTSTLKSVSHINSLPKI